MLRWFKSYFLMVKWVFLSYRPWLPLFFAVEICIAVAFIYGISYFYPVITADVAKYIITGAPTIILLTTGLVMVPQTVAQSRTEGTFDYIWSLPVPRMAHIAADTTVMIGTTLPSIVLAVVLGAFRFGFNLDASWLVIPAIILISASGCFIGYTIAFSVPKPMMVNVITQIMVFIVMMFSPVMFPVDRLPHWMQAIHLVLPIQYMADIVRGTLTDLPVKLGLAFGIVGAWTVACFALTYMMVRKRQ
jgi:ABC-2 type transport system permease protein